MKVNIIAVGKLQSNYQTLFSNYAEKLTFHIDLNVIEIKESNYQNKDIQIKKETEMILQKIPKNSEVYLCSIKGKEVDSIEFSNMINKDNITFIIGGSHGVDETYFAKKLKISRMTFPHQLFRIMIIEQIFRAFSIKSGSKYHK